MANLSIDALTTALLAMPLTGVTAGIVAVAIRRESAAQIETFTNLVLGAVLVFAICSVLSRLIRRRSE